MVESEILMIRAILLFAMILLVAAPEAGAAIWPFGGKAKETAADKPSSVFVAPSNGGNKAKKSVMDTLFNQPYAENQDVLINGKKLEGVTPAMMLSSYAPKGREEILKLAHASRPWEEEEMAKLKSAADARVAEARKKLEADIAKMQKEGAQQLANAPKESLPQEDVPLEEAEEPAKPVVNIFNKTTLDKPNKVFKNY